jgi:hypothetical protein
MLGHRQRRMRRCELRKSLLRHAAARAQSYKPANRHLTGSHAAARNSHVIQARAERQS